MRRLTAFLSLIALAAVAPSARQQESGANAIPGLTPQLPAAEQASTILRANSAPGPFKSFAGTYTGLFYDTNGVAHGSSGSFKAAVSASGRFTAKIQSGAASASFSGQFSALGTWSNAIPRKHLAALSVQLRIDMTGADTLTGQLGDGTWTAELTANRAVFSRTNPAPSAGKYTIILPGSNAPATPAIGNGFASVAVSMSGNVRLSGSLADGTRITQSATVSESGRWPLYVPLYSGGGSVFGWLGFTNRADADVAGLVYWTRPTRPASKYCAAGLTNALEGTGSAFTFSNGVPILGVTIGWFVVADGNLPQGFTNLFALRTNSTAANLGPNLLSLRFKTSTGLFKGAVANPVTRKTIHFSGAVLQKRNAGYGFFLGTNESGSVWLESTGVNHGDTFQIWNYGTNGLSPAQWVSQSGNHFFYITNNIGGPVNDGAMTNLVITNNSLATPLGTYLNDPYAYVVCADSQPFQTMGVNFATDTLPGTNATSYDIGFTMSPQPIANPNFLTWDTNRQNVFHIGIQSSFDVGIGFFTNGLNGGTWGYSSQTFAGLLPLPLGNGSIHNIEFRRLDTNIVSIVFDGATILTATDTNIPNFWGTNILWEFYGGNYGPYAYDTARVRLMSVYTRATQPK